MDGTLTYPRNTERRFFPRPVPGMPLLFTLADCCAEEEQVQLGNFTGHAKFAGRNGGSFLARLRQVKFASGFDNSMPHPDNAVDYAEQL